ncbi:MAG: hypothetical protein IKI29_01700 [Clostridia bacterium]|nr:hypothetical protein [Clostridia bacterium]
MKAESFRQPEKKIGKTQALNKPNAFAKRQRPNTQYQKIKKGAFTPNMFA